MKPGSAREFGALGDARRPVPNRDLQRSGPYFCNSGAPPCTRVLTSLRIHPAAPPTCHRWRTGAAPPGRSTERGAFLGPASTFGSSRSHKVAIITDASIEMKRDSVKGREYFLLGCRRLLRVHRHDKHRNKRPDVQSKSARFEAGPADVNATRMLRSAKKKSQNIFIPSCPRAHCQIPQMKTSYTLH